MKTYYYLIHIQYLGFRYHGWQKQPGVKTVEFMIEKTLGFVLGPAAFKILGSSRTDAKVSANHSAFMLFVQDSLIMDSLQKELNKNLPNDIRVINIEQKDQAFNIINTPRIKEYLYLFSFGRKNHPFSAALMSCFQEELDIDLMKKGAVLFEGKHNFIQYCTKPGPETDLEREVLVSRIEENTAVTASFFPEKSYAFHIHSKGFLRYQVRLIMGQLLRLGRNQIQLDDIKASLLGNDGHPLRQIAPASGLMLNKIIFTNI
ncbi:MAG: tRNA pseudouridine(38-40) synthase TruA [Deltaproteobacteria bacterium]|nr:tRNA pseudouridine(38-40) synthase TruA [Candidatus Desulfobacula maris]MBL6995685.1 tRNA pseudouridine(38-40) synthase TruA [Desulfobacula sp.]